MPATQLNITEQLVSIVGAEYVRSNEDTTSVFPANTQQVSEILSYADKNHLTISPAGGGTKQSWGNSAKGNSTKIDFRLELTRLNQVIAHPWQDLTCTVQAGCTWQQLQTTLKQHGQFVALDTLWPERATVGGILATNDSGALRHRYGSLRDLVIGMTLVLADGTIARSGGRVVKNVAGYDLCKLVTGSLGTLAVITEATFRLHPLPQHAQTFTVSAPQATRLAPLMASIRASHLLTQALQLRGDNNGFHLDIQLNAHPEAGQNEILQQMAETMHLRCESTSENVWAARESLLSMQKVFLIKIGALPTNVARIADEIIRLGGAFVAQSIGVIYASFPNNGEDHTAVESLYAYTDTSSMTILQTPSNSLVDTTPPWGPNKPSPLTQAIKHQFDPNHILNLNRFFADSTQS
jgi:glycolate oxidase FAD binding subunit